MWLQPDTLTVYKSHADIRAAWPNISFPSVITDTILVGLGLAVIQQIPTPPHDPFTQTCEEGTPVQIDSVWKQQWVVRNLTPEELKARVPTVVTMRQARLALLQAGLLSQVEAAIAAIEDAGQRQAVQIEWEYAADINRAHPWVQGLADALGLNETQLDDLFVAASRL